MFSVSGASVWGGVDISVVSAGETWGGGDWAKEVETPMATQVKRKMIQVLVRLVMLEMGVRPEISTIQINLQMSLGGPNQLLMKILKHPIQ